MINRRLCSVIATLVMLVAAIFMACPPTSAAFKNVKRQDRPPAFALQDTEGKEWNSSDIFEKKVTVVIFWSTWSPRSSEILADMEKLRKELNDKRLQLVAINAEHTVISPSDIEAVRKIVSELDLHAFVLIDQGLTVYNEYGTMALPSSMVVGEDGKVSFDLAGYPTTMRSDLADGIKSALGLPTSVELRPPEEYVPKNHALMYYNLGRRLAQKGQEEKAEAQLRISIERDGEFKKSHLLLGQLLKKRGLHEEALGEFRKVKELDPLNVEANYQLAAVSLRAGDLETAAALLAELHEEFPEREEFALGLSLAHKYRGEDEDAKRIREKAAGLEPAGAHHLYDFGGVAESHDDLAEAAGFYRRSLETALESERR